MYFFSILAIAFLSINESSSNASVPSANKEEARPVCRNKLEQFTQSKMLQCKEDCEQDNGAILSLYLKSPNVDVKVDPLTYWSMKQESHPAFCSVNYSLIHFFAEKAVVRPDSNHTLLFLYAFIILTTDK